jgi:hypothetical protein
MGKLTRDAAELLAVMGEWHRIFAVSIRLADAGAGQGQQWRALRADADAGVRNLCFLAP